MSDTSSYNQEEDYGSRDSLLKSKEEGIPNDSYADESTGWKSQMDKIKSFGDNVLRKGPGVLKKRLGLVVFGAVFVLFLVVYHTKSISSSLSSTTSTSSRNKWSFKSGDGRLSWPYPVTENVISASPLVNRPKPPREIDLASDALPLDATLEERLKVWEMSPGGRGPGVHMGLDGKMHEEVEPGTFNNWNLESCSNIDHQLNTHMIRYSVNVWGTMDREKLAHTRSEMIRYMREEVLAKKAHENYGQGRGIVMVAGNADTFKRVSWSVQYMRKQGGNLPVQVYHFSEEALPDDHETRRELEQLGVQLVEAKGETKDAGKTKSYHLKALAVVQCPWREVLYLDSDSIPARDPEYMFDSPSFQRNKIWATYDYWKTSANNAIWPILGIRCRDEWEMEAGQIFVDKKYHLDVFLLTKFMLEHHEWFFYFSDGDKDLFRWAMLALRKRWGVPGRWVGVAALPGSTQSGDHCGHTMLQYVSDFLFSLQCQSNV